MISPSDSPQSEMTDGKEGIAQTAPADATNIAGVQSNELPPIASPQPKKSFKFKLTIFMLCTISVVVAMGMTKSLHILGPRFLLTKLLTPKSTIDSVIVASALPAITTSLDGTSLEAFWVGTSYLLAQTVRNSR